MALTGGLAQMVGADSMENWKCIGSGGFGAVFKAHHKDWGFDVAIKILHYDPRETALWREAKYMQIAACRFVPRLYGLYHGSIPLVGTATHRGIVMDFMERGSVQSLLTTLSGPPPWPLAFRIAHQVAQGMNFLHARELMHHDLHPNNVLLDEDLNAKLADFGLSRVPTSVLTAGSGTIGGSGGFYKYMPPEAFNPLYQASRAYDRYSYGILLWSILTGKEVYSGRNYTHVALRIPEGDRPCLEDIDVRKADGLSEMVELMKSLWDEDAAKRKTFKECCGVTGHVFSRHSSQINITVDKVLTLLDLGANKKTEYPEVISSPPHVPGSVKTCDWSLPSVQGYSAPMANCPTGRREDVRNSFNQTSRLQSRAREKSNCDKARFVMDNKQALIQSVVVVMAVIDEMNSLVHSEIYERIFKQEFSKDQMRVLYLKVLNEGSESVQAAFYDAVKKHQFSAIEKLGGS